MTGNQSLGFMISTTGRINLDEENRIDKALRAFGALRKAVLLEKNLTLHTKRKIDVLCQCCCTMQSVGSCSGIQHRCISLTWEISNRQQWSERISMVEVRRQSEETVLRRSISKGWSA